MVVDNSISNRSDEIVLKQVRLILFFTQGLSLAIWDRLGMFEREVALYRALVPHLGGITFVTYGDKRELEYASRLPGIDIVCNRWGLSSHWYHRYLNYFPALFPTCKINIFKSNQTSGADVAMMVARKRGGRFISRCGYLFSHFIIQRHGEGSEEARRALILEKKIFLGADRVVVTTRSMQDKVVAKDGVDLNKIGVIPNYVDAEAFAPPPFPRKEVSFDSHTGVTEEGKVCILFVGRLDQQKNVADLLQALPGLSVELWLVGEGPLRLELESKAKELNLSIRFLGSKPHEELPDLLLKARMFVLPSHYEGHPKTLLEAMACGLPVIGTDVPGIRDVIQHESNGLLCEKSHHGIRFAIQRILDEPGLAEQLGRGARAFIVAKCALGRIVERELDLLSELAQ